ncbi:hypothetical protein AYJ54_12385 [Bradyrhizobium centrolobii]|uniref:Uncharacterized protein n=1 Tax=Bradyrhizobium centrolobii TaxID=1505087 RepID=A0A176YS52_9BRAD|nr:hypothetical protein [Bradyrhizobium centrolobii]OAF09977.1 hypothetical protein AYJ54_12385 [Bradyrhizobium centrolobii]
MSIIVDMLYREYCRARLAEMRKQLLIPVVSDESLQALWEDGEPSDPGDQDSGWATKEPSTIR